MIDKEILAKIVLDFKEWNPPSELIERDIFIDLKLPLKRATTIIGPRRTGKTYLLYFLIKKLLASGIRKERILYVNFESPKLLGVGAEDIEALYDVFMEINQMANDNENNWLFLDEIQVVRNWEIGIRGLLDNGRNKVFLTGSSSKLLSKEIASSMRGRTLSRLVLPFSFNEYLRFKRFKTEKYYSTADKNRLLGLFGQYFNYGGYPEIALHGTEWEKIISEILEVTIYRDLVERYKVRNTKVIKIMMNQLVRAKEFSVHKFFNYLKSLNIKISKNTLYEYLSFFHDAFIFFPLYKYSYSIKNTDQSIPKIYPVDNAFLSLITEDDKGKKLENMVFVELLRRGYETNRSLFYCLTGNGEVDFLLKEKGKITSLIQTCYDVMDYITKEREINSLLKSAVEFKCSDLKIITYDYDKTELHNGKKVVFISIWKWLLDSHESK